MKTGIQVEMVRIYANCSEPSYDSVSSAGNARGDNSANPNFPFRESV